MLVIFLWILTKTPLAASMSAQEMYELAVPLKSFNEKCGYDMCPVPIPDYLNVHLVPHSHLELGADFTFQEHMDGKMPMGSTKADSFNQIMESVLDEVAYGDRTFTLGVSAHFFHWWDRRSDDDKRFVYKMMRSGKIHFVGGGWSMSDEANANYQAVIDHHTLAMRRLNATFLRCGRPLTAWQTHSAGHSREVASLMAQMGFDGLFLSPISLHDELTRMSNKSLEFVWRGNDYLGKETDIFTHKLFDGFSSPPGFCFSGLCQDPLIVTSDSLFDNHLERAKVFLEDVQYRQWPHYRTRHALVLLGGAQAYYDASRWYINIDKLMLGVTNITGTRRMPIHVHYSTPACYLKAVYDLRQSFPTKQDDFFPHLPTSRSYYVGHFTSRPDVKYMVTEANAYLQITKQLQVLTNMRPDIRQVDDLKWIVGVMQDHNILSGAMTDFVINYYKIRLHEALQRATLVIENGLNILRGTPDYIYYRCALNESNCNIFELVYSSIVIYNPLAWPVTMPIRVPMLTNSSFVILNHKDELIPFSVMEVPAPVLTLENRNPEVTSEIVFISRDIPPLGVRVYYMHMVHQKTINKREVKYDDWRTHISKREAKDEGGTISNEDVEDDEEDSVTKRWNKDEDTNTKRASNLLSDEDGLDVNDNRNLGDNEDIRETSVGQEIEGDNDKKNNLTEDLWPINMIPHLIQAIPTINATTVTKINQLTANKKSVSKKHNHKLTSGTDDTTARKSTSGRRENDKVKYFEPLIPFLRSESTSKEEKLNEETKTTGINSSIISQIIRDNDSDEEDTPLPDYESDTDNETSYRRAEDINFNQLPIEYEYSKGMEATTRIIDEDTNVWQDKGLFNTHEMHGIGGNVLIDDIEGLESVNNATEGNKEIDYVKKTNENEIKNADKNNDDISNVKAGTILEKTNITANKTNVDDDDDGGDDGLDIELVNTSRDPDQKNFVKVNYSSEFFTEPPTFNKSDNHIKNKYITIHTDPKSYLPLSMSLSNGVTTKLQVAVGYYEADLPGRRESNKPPPGCYNFASMFRVAKGMQPLKVMTYLSPDVSELHVEFAPFAALAVRLYRDMVYVEVDWILGVIPAPEYVGKELFVRYKTDLKNDGVFYTDANGRQTMKRIRNRYPTYHVPQFDTIAGNIYPVTSKIYIEDTERNIRFSVFNDRPQGGTSLLDGTVTLFLNRRILSGDQDSPNVLNDISPLRGKHYLYLSKADQNKVFEKKFAKEIALMPRIFANLVTDMKEWYEKRQLYPRELSTISKRLPVGMHLLTLEKLTEDTLLLRLENILEVGDSVTHHRVVYIRDLFLNIRILSLVETTLAANQYLENVLRKSWSTEGMFVKDFNKFYGSNSSRLEYSDNDMFAPYIQPDLDKGLAFKPQQIRTFIVTYEYVKTEKVSKYKN